MTQQMAQQNKLEIAQQDKSNSISDLVSIYLMDYEKIRDEIRMRITQRHQFTNYSLLLFGALFSAMMTLLKQNNNDKLFPFGSLSVEYLFFILLTPWMFYSLMFMYLRHDYYIIHMTIFLEDKIAGEIRKLMEGCTYTTHLIDFTYLLGWEKFIQEARQRDQYVKIVAVLLDIFTKYFPFLFPVIVFISISLYNVMHAGKIYPEIIYALLWINIVGFIVVLAYAYVSLKKLLHARFTQHM